MSEPERVAQELHNCAASIAGSLAAIEAHLDAIYDEVLRVGSAWKLYGEVAPLGLRRQDLGANVLRFDGQLEAMTVDRLKLMLRDAERMFPLPVPSTQSLADVGTQFLVAIDGAIAAHAAQHRERFGT